MSDYGYRRPKTRRRGYAGGWSFQALFGLVVIFGMILFGGAAFFNALHTEEMTCTVRDKESVSKREGGHEYRVATEECGVLRVSDSLFSWTWHASDTYYELEVGETYDVTTRGHRVPFLSWFPNVTEARKVS